MVLGSLQNVRVKALRPAFVSDVISWMEESHLGFKMSDIVDIFMVCACLHQCFFVPILKLMCGLMFVYHVYVFY